MSINNFSPNEPQNFGASRRLLSYHSLCDALAKHPGARLSHQGRLRLPWRWSPGRLLTSWTFPLFFADDKWYGLATPCNTTNQCRLGKSLPVFHEGVFLVQLLIFSLSSSWNWLCHLGSELVHFPACFCCCRAQSSTVALLFYGAWNAQVVPSSPVGWGSVPVQEHNSCTAMGMNRHPTLKPPGGPSFKLVHSSSLIRRTPSPTLDRSRSNSPTCTTHICHGKRCLHRLVALASFD